MQWITNSIVKMYQWLLVKDKWRCLFYAEGKILSAARRVMNVTDTLSSLELKPSSELLKPTAPASQAC